MKKILSLLLCFMMTSVMLVGCSGSGGNSGDSDGDKSKGTIAIITPKAEHGWIAGVTYYAEQKCKELGVDYKTYQSSNVNEQANDIQDAIAAGSSAIVMFPHNEEVSVAAKAIKDANIPLVVFDRKIDVEYDAYIAGNNGEMGKASAEHIGKLLDGKGIVAVENTPSAGSVSSERVDGFKSVMSEKYPDIKLVDFTADGFAQEQGLAAATDLLTANSKIDAIYSLDDESSLGFIKAIEEAGRKDIKTISGGGGAQSYFNSIKENKDIDLFTATYSPMMMGDAIQLAVDILDGKKVEKENIIPTTIINKDNVADYLDESSPY